MVRISPIALAASLPMTALAAGLAGNEDYAKTRVLRQNPAKLQKRDGVQEIQSTGLTFSIGEGDDAKLYISPSGPSHKLYTLEGASSAGVAPVTVFNVEGDVSCDTLGDLVVSAQQGDDVWDEVSCLYTGKALSDLADIMLSGLHERDHIPDEGRLLSCFVCL